MCLVLLPVYDYQVWFYDYLVSVLSGFIIWYVMRYSGYACNKETEEMTCDKYYSFINKTA